MEQVRVGVGVIVLKDGKILMQQRTGAHGEGTWSFPGGHLEFGESFEACAARETREEVGVEIQRVRFAAITNNVFPENKHYVTVYMVSDWRSGEARICERDRSAAIGWFPWNQLPRPLFLPIESLLAQGYSPLITSGKKS